MKYQGPEAFRNAVAAEWARMEPNTTRPEPPIIIVGGIDTICSDKNRITILGDYQKSDEIDGLFERTRREPMEIARTVQEIMAACQHGNIRELEGEIPGVAFYNPSLDAVIGSSEAFATYLLGDCKSRFYPMDAAEAHRIKIITENFEQQFVEALVAREFGDTLYSRRLQETLLRGRPYFSMEKQGQYAFDKLGIDRRAAGNMGRVILTLKQKLEIRQVETITAAIGSHRLLGLPIEPDAHDTELIKALKNRALQSTPKEFFDYCKSLAERAYIKRASVSQLVHAN